MKRTLFPVWDYVFSVESFFILGKVEVIGIHGISEPLPSDWLLSFAAAYGIDFRKDALSNCLFCGFYKLSLPQDFHAPWSMWSPASYVFTFDFICRAFLYSLCRFCYSLFLLVLFPHWACYLPLCCLSSNSENNHQIQRVSVVILFHFIICYRWAKLWKLWLLWYFSLVLAFGFCIW